MFPVDCIYPKYSVIQALANCDDPDLIPQIMESDHVIQVLIIVESKNLIIWFDFNHNQANLEKFQAIMLGKEGHNQ